MTSELHIPRRSPGARTDWSRLASRTRLHAEDLPASELEKLEPILREDVLSEYDARFLSAYLHGKGLPFTSRFRLAEERWREDEERHYHHTAEVYRELYGLDPELLADRRARFEPLEELFDDELSILVLLAYDELATVGAYQANLEAYGRLGPAYREWVRALVADEAWHYAMFLAVLRDAHGDRLDQAEESLERVIAYEGTPYGATFVLDHDDPVFTPGLLERTARLLRRHLRDGSGGGEGIFEGL